MSKEVDDKRRRLYVVRVSWEYAVVACSEKEAAGYVAEAARDGNDDNVEITVGQVRSEGYPAPYGWDERALVYGTDEEMIFKEAAAKYGHVTKKGESNGVGQ